MMDASFADPETIGRTIVQERTRKEPFGRLRKDQNGMKMKMEPIGTNSRLERMERTQIGVISKAHCTTTVRGLRMIGMPIGGMMMAMIGLRIGHGMKIRLGRPPIGLLRPRSWHCQHHSNLLLLSHQLRLRSHIGIKRSNSRLLLQSLPVPLDWLHLIRLLTTVSLPQAVAARVTREAQAVH